MSDNCSEKLLKAGDETPTGSVTKHGARRAEPGHTRLLLLTLMLCVCVCVTAFSCMCVLSVMFACVASITTDNTDLLVFTLIIFGIHRSSKKEVLVCLLLGLSSLF